MATSRYFTRKRSMPNARGRLLAEELEARLLLNARYIVPLGVPIDNVTTFATIQAAMTTAGLVINDTITIEPGAVPGNLSVAGPVVANLTIQGDPTAPLAAIPQFTLSSTFTVSAAQNSFTLKNVNLGLILGQGAATGILVGTGNVVISGSSVVDINSTEDYAVILGGTTNVVTNSTFVADVSINALVRMITPASGSNNTIAQNTFVANSNATVNSEVAYADGSDVAVADKIVSNTFIANPGASLFYGCVISEGLTGLTIQGNTFSLFAGSLSLVIAGAVQNLLISNNVILGSIEIAVPAGATVSANVINNQISNIGNGAGLGIGLSSATSVANIKVQGNDFHNNATGVYIAGSGAAPLGGIDLGGGTKGSVGGNNFRGFTAAGTPTAAAIVVTSAAGGAGSISARMNLFSNGVAPATVVSDPAGKLVLANALSANAAFVQSLYENFLKRTGDTNNGSDAGYWVNAITGGAMTAAQAAASISHSAEALGVLVDGVYSRYLGRLPDAGGRAYFIGVLLAPRAAGGGVETMVAQLVTSSEYTQQFAADSVFIQSLYTRLLGRVATPGDVNSWLGAVTSSGRLAVANSFLGSGEFRAAVVRQFYGFSRAPLVATASIFLPLLHRPVAPSAPEINYWTNLGQDLLTMETGFVQTGEYFANG